MVSTMVYDVLLREANGGDDDFIQYIETLDNIVCVY